MKKAGYMKAPLRENPEVVKQCPLNEKYIKPFSFNGLTTKNPSAMYHLIPVISKPNLKV